MADKPIETVFPSDVTDRNLRRMRGKESTIVNKVKEEFSQSELTLDPWKNRLVRYNELYALVQSNKHYKGLSNIFVPEILRAVETIVAKLYTMIFNEDTWFEFTGRDVNDDRPAVAMTQLTLYQMDENNFKARAMDSLRQMVINGLTVRKILWDFEEVDQRRTVVAEDGKIGVKEVLETKKDHWTFEPVDLLSFHISDVSTPYNDIQKAEWIGEEYLVTKDWIRKRARQGWFSANAVKRLEKRPERGDATSQAEVFKDQRLQSVGAYAQQAQSKVRNIKITERWGKVPAEWVFTPEERAEKRLQDDDLVEAVIYLGGDFEILKLEANPFWHNMKPYVSCPYVPKEFDFAGIGAAQIGEKLQEELNDTRNQTMDNKTLILMNMWLKGRSAGIKNSDLRIRPMGVVATNDMKGLEPLRPPILTGVGVNIESVVKEDMRQSMGAASNLQGIAQGGVDTATESSIINKESTGRLFMIAQLYGEILLKKTLIFSEFLNYQFFDRIKAIKLIGAKGIKFRNLDPKEITGYKDVVVNISTDASENPSVKRQQAMNFLTIMQAMEPQLIQFHWKLLDKIYKLFYNGRSLEEIYEAPIDPEDLMSPEEEIDMVLAEQPVKAQRGQNHRDYLQILEQAFSDMKYALTPTSFDLFKKLIMSHEQMFQEEMFEQQSALTMQALAVAQETAGAGGTAGGGKVKNTSKNTQESSAPTTASLAREIGG